MEHESILHNPVFWVSVSFVCFVILAYKKVSKLAADGLNTRRSRIQTELDEARRLREEAEAILAQYKRKQAEYTQEAAGIIATARKDADTIRAHAEKDLMASLDARMKQAMDRIEQEESKAVADVRNHVVDIALAAARSLIADHVTTMSQDELVQLALSDIERKIH